MVVHHAGRGAPDEQPLAVRVDRPGLLRGAAREQDGLRDLDLAAEHLGQSRLHCIPHLCDHRLQLVSAVIPEPIRERRERVRSFMEEHIYPNEPRLFTEDDAADALIAELRQKAKEAGLWAPHLPPEAGGSGSGFIEYAYLNEEIGRSFIAQLIFGCQAPDAGNGEILHLFGTPEQKERFLEPLVAGETRSFFGMTEPEVAGSDPTTLHGRAVRDGDEWVIDAHKWFSSGADGAGFGVVMVVTDPDAEPHRRASMILVPTDAPGYEMVRKVPVMGHEGRGWGTHCETRFTGVRVPVSNTLGEPGDGFRIAQKRLGPGRIHHVMRWLGQMQRAFELMCSYSLERKAFGEPLADKQTVQNWIAESAAEIQACRLMTLQAAHRLDEGDEARVEISLIKFYAARVLNDVIDRAIQVHGGLGLTDDTPLARDVPDGPRRPHLRRRGRGAQDGRRAADPALVRGRGRLALHVTLEGCSCGWSRSSRGTRSRSGRQRRTSGHFRWFPLVANESRDTFHGWFESVRELWLPFAQVVGGVPLGSTSYMNVREQRPRARDRQHVARAARRGGRA